MSADLLELNRLQSLYGVSDGAEEGSDEGGTDVRVVLGNVAEVCGLPPTLSNVAGHEYAVGEESLVSYRSGPFADLPIRSGILCR